ncbi:glycosyltransferase family 39 protein [Methyloceanibacter sp.]|uniref:glycosyltransferase family 39 protein n=1 Tax=Methyloceanibacter sp. TaxID=1965321 RepID=UPI003D6C77E6
MAALLLAAVSVAVTLSLIDYPIGAAWDEIVKLRGVRTGRYAYYHPLFMIDLAQAVALVVHPADLPSLAQLVRVLGALAGGVMVFATFSLARLVLPDLPALAAATATAATPLFTVHARIFKEDIFVAAFLLLALAALIRLLQEPAPHRAILLGLLAGFAAGSKYIGTLFLPFAVIAILFVPTPGPERRWLRAATVAATSIGTFLLIMLPAIRRIERWRRGVNSELAHSIHGHDVPLPLPLTWGVFHLRESLWPGLGTPLLALGLIGLAAPFVAGRERRMPLALIASFALLWYAVHEATPLKPFPDFSRYMLPLVSLLIILGASFIHELLTRFDRRGAVAAIAVLLAAVPALSMSLRINSPDVDPRTIVPPIVAASGARVIFDRYADYERNRRILGINFRPNKGMADIVVTSSLAYDRFALDAAPGPMAAYYRELSSRPHLDVSNGRPTLAYFNPVVRIVALDGSVARLEKIAAEIRAAAPVLAVRLIDPPPKSEQ